MEEAKKKVMLSGIQPRNFNITPNGKYLLAACRDSKPCCPCATWRLSPEE